MSTTGQLIETSLPVRETIDRLAAMPMPQAPVDGDDPFELPGGSGLTTRAGDVKRGVGYAVSLKNLAFSEGFDDYAEARVTLSPGGVEVETAAVEVGQGLVMVMAQIVRTVLGTDNVTVRGVDTSEIGSAGSTSASRQTQMSGGAAYQAAVELRDELLDRFGGDELDAEGIWKDGDLVADLKTVCAGGPISRLVRFRHPPTEEADENGQGNLHADFAVAAHRAIVDVDTELGLVRVVRVDTVQDVGKVLHPQALIGQVEGGIMQGVGLAVMEEIVLDRGVMRNANFTDYLLPTILDAPDVAAEFIEEPSPWGPFGAKGAGEPPTISSTPAVVAAIRQACGRDLSRVPVRPQDIAGV